LEVEARKSGIARASGGKKSQNPHPHKNREDVARGQRPENKDKRDVYEDGFRAIGAPPKPYTHV
jgi:hypothetical protein